MGLKADCRIKAASAAIGPTLRPTNMRLLLVEDHEELAQLTKKSLVSAGFAVDIARTVLSAREAIETNAYVAVILDLGLPDGDGSAVLRWMRTRDVPTPVLILTAHGSLDDRVSGLNRGADDYLVKPFAQEELIARLHAILRRPRQFLGKPCIAANVAFDPVGRTLYVNDRPQSLSARELALLEILLKSIGRMVPKKLAEDQLFGLSDEVHSNAIEVYVHRLRKQLSQMGAAVEIHTIRGLGYLMTEVKS